MHCKPPNKQPNIDYDLVFAGAPGNSTFAGAGQYIVGKVITFGRYKASNVDKLNKFNWSVKIWNIEENL